MTKYKYGNPEAPIVLIQSVGDHDLPEIEGEVAQIRKLTALDFQMIAVKVDDWNLDLSPWRSPAVFGKEDFGGGAASLLEEILRLCSDESKTYYLGGYSLAGLFSLWASYQTDRFAGIAAASPSVWFPGFLPYMKEHENQSRAVYLSLGDKEEKTRNPALKIEDLRQDEDCLDTWFSSWLWPISLFDGILNPGNEEINYYYPTSDLVTGPDIIFFWVARMIMAGYEYEGKMPFKNVYFTGIVRDKLGRKMSKSLGNSPDPLDLIDRYGADGVRMGMMLSAPAGNDILFDDALCEQGRNFNNKIWNAFRLVKGWEVSEEVPVPEAAELAMRWFESKQNAVAAELADLFGKYRLSEALMAVYKLFWDEFSSWYLEMIKPAYGQPINKKVYDTTIGFFDNLLHLLHPFMPFITEELWQHIVNRKDGESLMVSPISMSTEVDEAFVQQFEVVKEVISNVRSIRLQKNIAQKEPLELQVVGENPVAAFDAVIIKMCNLSAVTAVEAKADGAAAFMVGTTEFAVPLGNMIDVEAEIARMEAELKHKEGFLQGVLKKLSNEKFVNNAPAAVIEMERKKQADAESIISSLKESIAALKKA